MENKKLAEEISGCSLCLFHNYDDCKEVLGKDKELPLCYTTKKVEEGLRIKDKQFLKALNVLDSLNEFLDIDLPKSCIEFIKNKVKEEYNKY